MAVNDTFSLGQLFEPIFTLSLIVPVAFFAVLKVPLSGARAVLGLGWIGTLQDALPDVAFFTEKLPLLSTLIVPTLTSQCPVPRVPGSAQAAAVAR